MPRRGTRTVVEGVTYRSAFEAAVARDLLTREVPFHYEARTLLYEVPRLYVPDFQIIGPGSEEILVEAKGWMPATERRKLVEVKCANPDVDLRVVFQRATTRIGRGRRSMEYCQWADRHGIPWAEQFVPEAWLR